MKELGLRTSKEVKQKWPVRLHLRLGALVKELGLRTSKEVKQEWSVRPHLRLGASVKELGLRTSEEVKQKWPVRLGVRTRPFHGRNTGSIPVRATRVALKPVST